MKTNVDRKVRSIIENMAWEATVGCGREADDISNEPDGDVVAAVNAVLGRRMTNDEETLLISAWRRCISDIASP